MAVKAVARMDIWHGVVYALLTIPVGRALNVTNRVISRENVQTLRAHLSNVSTARKPGTWLGIGPKNPTMAKVKKHVNIVKNSGTTMTIASHD